MSLRDQPTVDDPVRDLRGPAAQLAAAAALLGQSPRIPAFGRLESGEVLGYDLRKATSTRIESTDDGSVVVHAEGLDPGGHHHDVHPNETSCELVLSNGRLTAQWAERTRAHFGRSHSATFTLKRWRWWTRDEPVAWIAPIDGGDVWRGNAIIRSDDGDDHVGCECLEGGGLRWMITPRPGSSGRFDVVVEALTGDINGARLRTALRAVSFVFGRRVQVGRLVGVDANLQSVGAMSLHLGRLAVGPARRPVPLEVHRDRRWDPQLFRCLADRIRDEDATGQSATHLATEAYLDAQADHIEGACLKLVVALEAFCKKAGNVSAAEDRADRDTWIEWVASQEATIKKLALDDGVALVRQLKGLWRGPSSRISERYFESCGVELPRELTKPLREARNRIAHSYTLGDYSPNFEAELKLIAIAQVVLVAALALHVGYHGPIDDRQDGAITSAWWPGDDGLAPPPHLYRIKVHRADLESTVADWSADD